MKVEQAVREFKYNGMALADPGPGMSAEEVRTFYAGIYPELNNAEIEGPTHKGAKAVYEFRRAVGTKGAREKMLKLQMKPRGAWTDVAEFDPARTAHVEQAVIALNAALNADDIDWRIIEVGGRSPKVKAYCIAGEAQWRAK